MPEPIISIRGLSHRYSTRAVLDALDLDIDAGTAVAVLGRNGSGKTTLFRIISTLIPPTDGTVRILNGDVVADRQRIRESLGVVFQSPSLDRMLSVEENLRHHGHLYRLSGKTLADRINEMLERFSLTDRRRERVDRLSGGLRRRVELAKGLLTRPDLLLLDEPSTGLDPAAQAELWQQLCLIRDAGVTVLLTTHHMMEADICDRVLILDGGRIHADGSPDALKAQIGGDVVTIAGSGVIEMKPDVDAHLGLATQAIGGTLRFNTPSARRVIVPLMELLGDRAASVSVGKPSLQDVFMQMTGKTLSADDAS